MTRPTRKILIVLIACNVALGVYALLDRVVLCKVPSKEAAAPQDPPAGRPGTKLQGAPAPKPTTSTPARNPKWAAPIEKPGLPNLHKVCDALYRGAQPSAEGMRELKKMGVKTVVNLRSFHSDRDEIGDTGLGYEHIYMKAWHPEDEEVVRFLQIVTDKDRTPAFVHCQHGADRTGTMCAIYRIAVQGWSKDDAIAEMTQGGFGYHTVWENLIGYLRELDIEAIKKRAGLAHEGVGE